MIETTMYLGLGFLVAALGALLIMPLVHGRAVRLTMRQLESAIPSSMTQVLADKDLQRAEFALSMRQLEIKVGKLETQSAGALAELGRKRNMIDRLNTEVVTLRDQIARQQRGVRGERGARGQDHPVVHALPDNNWEMAKLKSILDERLALVNSQRVEIVALKMQVQTLKDQLTATASADQRDIVRPIIPAPNQQTRARRAAGGLRV